MLPKVAKDLTDKKEVKTDKAKPKSKFGIKQDKKDLY